LSWDAGNDLYVLDGFNQRLLVVPFTFSGGLPTEGTVMAFPQTLTSNLYTPSSLVVWPGGKNITITDLGNPAPSQPGYPAAAADVITLTPGNPTVSLTSSTGTGTATGSVAMANVGSAPIGYSQGNPDLFVYDGTATAPNASQTIQITNTNGGACTPLAVTLSIGEFCTFGVSYTPNNLTATQTLAVTPYTNALGGSTAPANLVTLNVTGTYTGAGILITPTTLNFGGEFSGNPDPQTITITNTGASALVFSSFTLTLNQEGEFSISANTCPVSPAGLAAGASCTVSIDASQFFSFAGTANGTLSIADNALNSPQTVTMTIDGSLGSGPTVPSSGTTCNGIYSGVFSGNVTVSAGQDCIFVNGGGVNGNVTENGGNLELIQSQVSNNVQINSGTFTIGPGTTIGNNLQIQGLPSGSGQNQVCGTTVKNDFQVQNNGTAVIIGDPPSCAGNTVRGNLQVQNNSGATTVDGNTVTNNLQDQNNTGPTQVFNNVVGNNLTCQGDSSITGGGNTANSIQGQCVFPVTPGSVTPNDHQIINNGVALSSSYVRNSNDVQPNARFGFGLMGAVGPGITPDSNGGSTSNEAQPTNNSETTDNPQSNTENEHGDVTTTGDTVMATSSVQTSDDAQSTDGTKPSNEATPSTPAMPGTDEKASDKQE
jgi:hypothetical protein